MVKRFMDVRQSATSLRWRNRHLVVPGFVAVGLVFLVLLVGMRQARARALVEIRSRLAAQVALRIELVNDREDLMRREVLFLAALPTVQSIVRFSDQPGSDRKRVGHEQAWKRQLATIFLGFARTNPEILHLRFIGVFDSGRELVRVDRRGDSLIVVPPHQLGRVADRDYFIQTSLCKPGEIFLSDLKLDRTDGVLEVPHRPILRVGAPVFDAAGSLDGMIFVSIDANPLLEDFRRTLMAPYQTYLTNDRGDFLSHPDDESEFGFDLGSPHRWQDEFEASESIDTGARWIRRLASPAGSLLVLEGKVPLGTSGRHLVIRATYPDSALQATVSQSRNATLAVVAGILGLGGLLLFVFLRLQRGVRQRIEALNEDLEKQVRERTAQIESASSLQRTILAAAGYAIIATDPEGIITLFNPAAEAMLGYDASQVVGRMTPLDFRDMQEVQALAEALSRNNGVPVPVGFRIIVEDALLARNGKESTFVRRDGIRLPVLLTVRPLCDVDGGVIGYLGIAVDLTERRKAEETLRARTEEAVAANHSKDEFLANMSHEIRTPLSAVLGLALVLENRPLEPDARDLVRKIRRAGTSLKKLIDDVLDFSKITGGHLRLEEAPFRLDDVLDNLATIMGATAGSKKIELVIGAAPVGTTYLVGDSHRLEQVLINLTGNAIKFTESGSVVVSMEVQSRKDDLATLRFSVRDSGIGIPLDKQGGIFDSFSQADTSITRRYGGTGLGLAICRQLVEKMGGAIEVESLPGEGCEFRFTVVMQTANPEEAGTSPLRNLEILVADDHDLSRDAIAAVAQSIGWRIVAVSSGAEAIEATLERQRGLDPFDVLLLDWKMPDLDGLSTVVRLRERMENRTPPIVLLATAYSREQLANLPESKNVDGILSKPLTGSSLYNAVMEARTRRGERIVPQQKPGEAHLSGIRILVVDDNEIIRDLLIAIFHDEGAQVELAENGELALRWLLDNVGAVDIILMDVQMPVMDGYTAARLIRNTPSIAKLPIIALSAGVFQSEREAALASGMDEFLPKPFQVPDLVRVILDLTGGGGSPPSGVRAELRSQSSDSSKLVIDVRTGQTQWKSKEAFLAKLVKFAADYTGFTDGIALGTVPDLAFALHRLKGTAGVLAMPQLTAQAERLGRIVHDGGDPLPGLPALCKAMDEVMARIAELDRQTDSGTVRAG